MSFRLLVAIAVDPNQDWSLLFPDGPPVEHLSEREGHTLTPSPLKGQRRKFSRSILCSGGVRTTLKSSSLGRVHKTLRLTPKEMDLFLYPKVTPGKLLKNKRASHRLRPEYPKRMGINFIIQRQFRLYSLTYSPAANGPRAGHISVFLTFSPSDFLIRFR